MQEKFFLFVGLLFVIFTSFSVSVLIYCILKRFSGCLLAPNVCLDAHLEKMSLILTLLLLFIVCLE